MSTKSHIAYFLLFLIAVVFCHNATLHQHSAEGSEDTEHQHHHQHDHDLLAWLSDLLHDWQHAELGERHFEDFTLSLKFEKTAQPVLDIIATTFFIPDDKPLVDIDGAYFFYDLAYLEPPPEGFSSPRGPPSFS